MSSTLSIPDQQLVREMAENWYGYGHWAAPFWFLGPEPGGDDYVGPARAFAALGRGELLDCEEHHRAFGCSRYFEPPFPLQPTWRRLMILLFAFLGQEPSTDLLKLYQAERLGRLSGETCVFELCPIASKKLKKTEDPDRIRRRIKHIRQRIDEYQPTFVVMYGRAKKAEYETLAGGAFDGHGMRVGRTIALLRPSPTAFGATDDEWIRAGHMLRDACR